MNTEIALPVQELKQALSGFNRMVGRKTTLPVLSHVRISRNTTGQVKLQATDLDAHATYTLGASQTGEAADLLVPLEQLNKAFKSSCATKQDLALVCEGKNTRLRYFIGGNPVLQPINTLPVEEWPPHPEITEVPKALQPGFGLALKQAMQCCSEDPTRQLLRGACLDARETQGHYIVGTNGRFLYSANSFTFPLKDAIIVPDSKFISGSGFLDNEPCYLAVQPGKKPNDIKHICLSNQQWQLVTREIEGQYPNWKQVVPPVDAKWTEVDLSEPAIEQLLKVIPNLPGRDDVNNAVRIRIQNQVLLVEGRNPEDKEYTTVAISDVRIKGKDRQLCLNRDYLLPALRFGMKTWAVLDELSPMVLNRGGKRMVIMPVRPTGPAPNPVAQTPSASVPPTTEAIKPAEEKEVPMPKDTNKPDAPKPAEPPTTVSMIDQVERVKETLKNALRELTGLTDLARQMERDKRAGDKEVETARTVLKKLQSVSI